MRAKQAMTGITITKFLKVSDKVSLVKTSNPKPIAIIAIRVLNVKDSIFSFFSSWGLKNTSTSRGITRTIIKTETCVFGRSTKVRVETETMKSLA